MANRFKHDQIFRKSMDNPLVAYEFFETHLPKHIKDLLELSSLKMEKDSFVEPNLRDSISDVLFSAKFNNRDGYIFLLVEHQSTTDHMMAFRLFKYMLNICDRHLTLNPNAKAFPLVYPLIFFNGQRKYNVPLNIWNLFENSKLAKDIWTNDYQLVNVHDIPDSEFRRRVWSGLLEFFMKYRHKPDLINKWQEMADILPKVVNDTIGYDYIETLLFYSLTNIEQDDKIKLEQMLKSHLNPETGTKLMGSLAQHWEQIGEAKGAVKWKAEGKAEGKAEMIKIMRDNGHSIEEISKITKLPITEINQLLKLT